jgi:hypothetical protein
LDVFVELDEKWDRAAEKPDDKRVEVEVGPVEDGFVSSIPSIVLDSLDAPSDGPLSW